MQFAVTDEFGNPLESQATSQWVLVATVRASEDEINGGETDQIFLDIPFLFSNDVARVAQVIAVLGATS